MSIVGGNGGTKCQNGMCTNEVGDGDFALTTLFGSGTKALQLLLCTPCAATLNDNLKPRAMTSVMPVISSKRPIEKANEGTEF